VYIKSSEIGKRSVVLYRSKMLGITPLGYSDAEKQWLYTLEDADRILGYKNYKFREHNIQYLPILETILKDDSLHYNIEYAVKRLRIRKDRLKSMIDEYHLSGCFITPSKMNYEK
jgi:hypothetical protein